MSFWNRLFGTEPRESLNPQRLDYLNEGDDALWRELG